MLLLCPEAASALKRPRLWSGAQRLNCSGKAEDYRIWQTLVYTSHPCHSEAHKLLDGRQLQHQLPSPPHSLI